MSYNSRSVSVRSDNRQPIGRMKGYRPSHKERGLCTHGVPKSRCKKEHREDTGPDMAGGAMT